MSSVKELKKYLQQKNIVIEQFELTITNLIKRKEKIYEIPLKQIQENNKSRKKFEKKFSNKVNTFGKSIDELSNFINHIQDFENFSDKELEDLGNQIISNIEISSNFWNKEDQEQFDSIYSEFLEQQKRIIVTTKISNIFLKNEIWKTIIQLSIFSLSFITSYYLSIELEPHLPKFNDITTQFLIAAFLFLTLEKIIEKIENHLLYYRVNILIKYFQILIVLTDKLKLK